MRVFLEGVELTVGRLSIPKGPKEKYFTGHAEPRADDWLAIGRGDDMAELDARIAAGSAIRSKDRNREDSSDEGDRTVN